MGIINYSSKERDLLARLMRAEAVGEGSLGMLMVGNVVLNRALASCYIFNNIRTIEEAVYQSPGGFSGTTSSLFFSNPTTRERQLADRILRGEYFYPATDSLWFYAPGNNNCSSSWYEQPLAGRYKNHCFYMPNQGVCKEIY